MNTKILLSSVCLVIILVTGAYFVVSPFAKDVEQKAIEERQRVNKEKQELLLQNQKEEVENIDAKNTETKSSHTNDIENTVTQPIETVTSAPALIPASPSAKPVPTRVPESATPLYTSVEVAKHSGESSCWSIINGNVYDLTSFVTKHPGGDRNILKICGKDGTTAFEGQHSGDSKPEATLEKFYLGVLTN